jgi:hypothetical protein
MTSSVKVLCTDRTSRQQDGAKNLEVGSRQLSVVSKNEEEGFSHG